MKERLGISPTGYAALSAYGVAAVLVTLGFSILGWATVACGIFLTYRTVVN